MENNQKLKLLKFQPKPEIKLDHSGVIARLEEMLQLAKDGQLKSIAIAATRVHDKNASIGYNCEPGDGLALLGAMLLINNIVADTFY